MYEYYLYKAQEELKEFDEANATRTEEPGTLIEQILDGKL